MNPIARRFSRLTPPFDEAYAQNTFSRIVQRERAWVFVNCWYMAEHESHAMWRIFGRGGASVAIRSSVGCLRRCLPPRAHIGTVTYIDYETGYFPSRNALHPFVHKRREYESERELRAVITRGDRPRLPNGYADLDATPPETGELVPVDVDALVQEIRVAPGAEAWLAELVTRVQTRYGVSAPLARSALDTPPHW